MNRRLQLRLWLLALDRYELKLRLKVARARNAFIKASAKAYEANDGQLPNWTVEAHKRNLTNILAEHYQAVIPHFGSLALKQVKSRRISHKAAESLFSSNMLEWVRTQSLLKATMISDTDHNDVLAAIKKGIEDGEGVATIASEVRKSTGLTTFRAATVARTETHSAATFGSIETARAAETDLGIVLQKVWLPTLDDRTRPEHRAMEGKDPIGMGERFNVGGETMDRPGDPSASPENVINCRCAIAYEEKE